MTTYLLVFFGCGAVGIIALGTAQYIEQKREAKLKAAQSIPAVKTESTPIPQPVNANSLVSATPSPTPQPPLTPSPSSSPLPTAPKTRRSKRSEDETELQRRRQQALQDLNYKKPEDDN